MKIDVLYSKIHRATVTDADLNYEGSVSIDPALLKKAKMFLNQKVDIVNCNNGARFSTYIIEGKKGEVCLNGAAARLVQRGDKVIIIAYAQIDIANAKTHEPTVVFVDDKNKFKEIRKEKKH
ncbi:aspartate 1-decarboxylase [Pseudobdellovibrio exovorus]|uniref:Aspartate 1-decarboxylase n=1 Tax=Pseudobdellovibrio exovorus JSS TaxID=1184267 RepID=M4VEN8_9BACT|nr:aspartate 1-decarboxylase [Pseudobdellovibrio exovorus]AGH96481.1 aspartate alpha-decarboxylase [Pseudobdellovibrio exovorus JSS]